MFDKSFDRVFVNEGGFQCDRDDRGNWTSGQIGIGQLKGTKFGISAMTYPDLDIRNLTKAQAKAIYKRDWWDKLGMDAFHPAMAYQMFDSAINHGMHNTTKILQTALQVNPDGVIGPKTMEATGKRDLNDLLMLFLAERLFFMTNVKTWPKYGKGWAGRVAYNLKLATLDN